MVRHRETEGQNEVRHKDRLTEGQKGGETQRQTDRGTEGGRHRETD